MFVVIVLAETTNALFNHVLSLSIDVLVRMIRNEKEEKKKKKHHQTHNNNDEKNCLNFTNEINKQQQIKITASTETQMYIRQTTNENATKLL